MKRSYITFIAAFSSLVAFAQQEALTSRHVFTGTFMNPAACGSQPWFSASLLYRNQWTGFDHSPRTFLLQGEGSLAQQKMGVGLSLSKDKIGVTDETDIYGSYSYRIQTGNARLAFGLRAGISHYRARLTTLTYWDNGDGVFAADIQNNYIPKFGFGIYYYSDRYFAGLALPTLLAYDHDYRFNIDLEKSSYLRRHYYLSAGYVFNLDAETWKLKPTVLARHLPGVPLQADLGLTASYKNLLSGGLAFRTGDAVIAMVEYRTNQGIRIGYSYDVTFSKLRYYSQGSHEIMISYIFGNEEVKSKASFSEL